MKTHIKLYILGLLTLLVFTASKCGYFPYGGMYVIKVENKSEAEVNNMQIGKFHKNDTIWSTYTSLDNFPDAVSTVNWYNSEDVEFRLRLNEEIIVDTTVYIQGFADDTRLNMLITLNPDLTLTIK